MQWRSAYNTGILTTEREDEKMSEEVKVKIQYSGKEVEKVQVVDGVVKTGNAYLVRCSETGAWTYCNQERLDKLAAKFGSIEKLGLNYVGRVGKKTRKTADEGNPEPKGE